MASIRKTSGFFMKELLFSFCLYVLTPGTDATGFIVARSCGKEIAQLDLITFPRENAVWMKIVKATFLFIGHGVVGTTSGPVLHSGDPRGGHCNLTPFLTMQVIPSPDNKIRLKDPSSKIFICSITNEALSLREATGYISCETGMNDAEREITNVIKTTDKFTSMLLDDQPKPATTRSPRRERTSPESTLGFPVREKRKLHQITTTENLLQSKSFVQPENTVTSTAALSLTSKEALGIVKSNDSLLFPHVIETPQPRMVIRDSSQRFLSTTVLLYESKSSDITTPTPSVHKRNFLESSITVTSIHTKQLNSTLQPSTSFSVSVSSVDFNVSEDMFASASELPSETTMEVSLIQESSLVKIDQEPDVSVKSLFEAPDSFGPQSTMFGPLMETVTADFDYESYIPQYSEIFESTVLLNEHHSYNSSFDFPENRADQSTVIMPASVLEPSSNILVPVSKGTSSNPKNASFKKSQAPVKGVSTNEEIQNRIINFLSSLTNIFHYFKDATSNEQDSSLIPQNSSVPFVNLPVNGKNNSDEAISASSSVAIKSFSVFDESPAQTSPKVSELETSPFFWPILRNDTYPEPSQIDNNELSIQNGNSEPNDILSYISKKSNISLEESKEVSLPGSPPLNERKHSPSDVWSLNSSLNSSYAKRLSDKLGNETATTNLAFPETTGKSLHSDVNRLGASEDSSRESAKSRNNTWILLIGGGIVLQIQLIIGLTIIWCCLRRKFKRYADTESPTNIYDGFSKVVNFRNSGKLADENDKSSAHEGEENENGSTSEANPKLPKCLTTSL